MPCYIAKTPCGCYVAAMTISTGSALRFRDDAREVLRWMRTGLDVSVVDVDFVRSNLTGCDHRRVRPAQKSLAFTPARPSEER